jgi:exodeoxyribonuclease III
MKIITWNVNGLRAVHRKGDWVRVFEEDPDILCIQETKSLPEQLPDEARSPKGYHSYFHFPHIKRGYSGVAIFSKKEPKLIQNDLGIPEMDQEGRLILAKFEGFTLINCYFPNGGGAPERLAYKLAFYDHFLGYIENLKKENPNIIFCGDVNVAHKEMDLARPRENANHIGFLPVERAWVDRLIARGWVDIFRHFYPDRHQAYTYWDQKSFARERNVGWRIDYFFSTPEMLKSVKNVEILDHIYGSDHCPVSITLDL